MCGIVGYNGKREATPILIDSLKRLEYRGYDSAGIAVSNNSTVDVYKEKGRIVDLERILPKISGTVGIGHTRWATSRPLFREEQRTYQSRPYETLACIHETDTGADNAHPQQ